MSEVTEGLEPEELDLEGDLPENQDVFPRDYVEKLRRQAAGYRTRSAEYEGLIEESFGDADTARQAANLWQMSATKDGLARITVEALTAMGYSPERIQEFISTGAQAPAPPAAPPVPVEDPTQPVTWELLQQWGAQLQGQIAQQVNAPIQQMTMAQAQQVAIGGLESALAEVGVADPVTRTIVLELADRYVDEDERDPYVLAEAVRRGYGDYEAHLQGATGAALQAKAQANRNLPTPLTGGASPSGLEALPAPKNVKSAHERLRMRLEAAGED